MSQLGSHFVSFLLHFDLLHPFRVTYATHEGILGEEIQFVKTNFKKSVNLIGWIQL